MNRMRINNAVYTATAPRATKSAALSTEHRTSKHRHVKYAPEGSLPRVIHRPDEIRWVKRRIRLLVVHCSATRENMRYSAESLLSDHLHRGMSDAGYHYYIRRDGTLYRMRPLHRIGAHARGHNDGSIGVCYEGGLTAAGVAADTRTPEQRQTLTQLIVRLRQLWPDLFVLGHRDLSPDRNRDGVITRDEWMKECPCFDARLLNTTIPVQKFVRDEGK